MNSDKSFYGLGIAPRILEILDKLQFKVPTPIQEKSIPLAIEEKDLIGVAQTGTGKTLAFGIPMVQKVLQGKSRGLVVLPTRELALQVYDTLKKIGGPVGLRAAVLIGGEQMGRQLRELRNNPQIIIGTPGRILDHLQQRTLSLGNVGILVLDEADRMLDMGFAPQLNRILKEVPRDRQTMLFSATMPEKIVEMARGHMKLPVSVEIAPAGSVAQDVTQELFFVSRDAKQQLLEKTLYDYKGSVLIFARTKHGVKKITKSIHSLGHASAEIHSNRSLNQRKEALEGFRSGKYRVLVATDIASRGIDVKGIELVLNYDLPSNPEDYIHRIGRTARAGSKGHAITFATPDQRGEVRSIERLMRKALPQSRLPDLPPSRTPQFSLENSSSGRRPFRNFHPSSSRGSSTGRFRPRRFRRRR